MGNIIKFKQPKKITIEDIFMESLTEEQNEMFGEIILKIQSDYEELQDKLLRKTAECEMLKLENEALKGGINET